MGCVLFCFLTTVCVFVADCSILHTVMLSVNTHRSHIEMRKVFQYVCGTFVLLLYSVVRADSHFLKCFSHRQYPVCTSVDVLLSGNFFSWSYFLRFLVIQLS